MSCGEQHALQIADCCSCRQGQPQPGQALCRQAAADIFGALHQILAADSCLVLQREILPASVCLPGSDRHVSVCAGPLALLPEGNHRSQGDSLCLVVKNRQQDL